MITFLIIILLLFISALFSLAETGITGASRPKIFKRKIEGDKRAAKVAELLERKDKLITTVLLINNAVNIGASALTTAFFIKMFGNDSESIVYATIIMTLAILIFSEVLPKVFALKNPESVALTTGPAIALIMKIVRPITYVVEKTVNFLLKILRLEKHGMEGVVHGLDALRGALELYHEEGDVVKEDKDMLGSILDLDETEVQDIMHHRRDIEMIDISLSAQEVVDIVLKSQFSRIPVYSGASDNIIGILHSKTLMKNWAESKENVSQLDIKSLLVEPWFVPETTTLKEQLIAFREKRQHFALVVDEYGSLMGIITLEDILEEIVGNIEDEYDVDYDIIEDNLDGSYTVDGTLSVRDLNREMHWELPVDVANTVAGLIIADAEMIPSTGQIFNFHGFRFEILKKKRNQLTKIKISKLPAEEEGGE